MAHRDVRTFSDPDDYAAAFGSAKLSVTICGPGDFTAQITRLNLRNLGLYCCTERLSRIAFVSLLSDRLFVTFPHENSSFFVTNGHALGFGEMVFHDRGERTNQVIKESCQWGLLSLSSEQLERTSKALSGRKLTIPEFGKYQRPARAHAKRFTGYLGKPAGSRRLVADLSSTRRSDEPWSRRCSMHW